MEVNDIFKECIECKEEKIIFEFNKDPKKDDGYNNICKICYIKKWKERQDILSKIKNHKKEKDPKIFNELHEIYIEVNAKIKEERIIYKKEYSKYQYKRIENYRKLLRLKNKKEKKVNKKQKHILLRVYVTVFLKPKILKRDKYKCVLCDKVNSKFEVHHIIPVSMNHNLIDDEKNLVTLCKKCHKLAHNNCYRDIDYIILEKLKLYIKGLYE